MLAKLLFGLLSVMLVMSCKDSGAFDLEAHLSRAITNRSYRGPTSAEFDLAKELFKQTLSCQWVTSELKTNWAQLGFELREVSHGGEVFLLLAEPLGQEEGRGWYLFRTEQSAKTAIQAPHARNDVRTGLIGLKLFLAGPVRAYAASTITRHLADVAHLERTYFQAFTLAFAEICPTGIVVQLHGFDSQQHKGIKGDIVASAGTNRPASWLTQLVQRLEEALSLRVLAYPEDTNQLGGTTNAQAKALRSHAHCRFLHLEMTRELRERLVKEKKLQRLLVNTLSEFQAP